MPPLQLTPFEDLLVERYLYRMAGMEHGPHSAVELRMRLER